MFSTPMKSAGENVKDELITQNTLIGDIAQSLGLTVTEASGSNTKAQLEAFNQNLQLIKNGSNNFLEENIKKGITIWGKTGTLESKIEIISLTPASETSSVTINHSMGNNAKAIALMPFGPDSVRWSGYTKMLYAFKDGEKIEAYMSGGSYYGTKQNFNISFNDGSIGLSNLYGLYSDEYRIMVVG